MTHNTRPTAAPRNPGLLTQTRQRAAHARISLSATLELTERCNLRCRHCYIVTDRPQDELTTEQWKQVLDRLADAGTLFLTLTGGEPLVRDDFFEIATHARLRQFAFILFSNGTRINAETADRLRELQPQRVEISLLGGTATTHDKLTGVPGSFQCAIDGATHLIARGISVQFKVTWMRPNIEEAERIVAIARDLGASLRRGFLLLDHRKGDTTKADLRPTDAQLRRIAEREAAQRDRLSPPRVLSAKQQAQQAPCGAGQASCCINARGIVTPCVALRLPIGNILTTPFATLWRESPVLERLRRTHISDLPACRGCELYTQCRRCAGLALAETGDLLGPSPQACRLAHALSPSHNADRCDLL